VVTADSLNAEWLNLVLKYSTKNLGDKPEWPPSKVKLPSDWVNAMYENEILYGVEGPRITEIFTSLKAHIDADDEIFDRWRSEGYQIWDRPNRFSKKNPLESFSADCMKLAHESGNMALWAIQIPNLQESFRKLNMYMGKVLLDRSNRNRQRFPETSLYQGAREGINITISFTQHAILALQMRHFLTDKVETHGLFSWDAYKAMTEFYIETIGEKVHPDDEEIPK
jgi:hypothetical protein